MSQYRDSFMLVEEERGRRKKSEESKHKGKDRSSDVR